MTDETLREWIERAQFTVTSPTSAPHVNEPIQVVTVEGVLAELAGTYLSGVSGTSSGPSQSSANAASLGCPRCGCIDQLSGQCMQCGLEVARYEVFEQEMQAYDWAGEREILAAEITDQIQALPVLDESEFYDRVHKIIVEILADIPRPNSAPALTSGDGSESAGLRERLLAKCDELDSRAKAFADNNQYYFRGVGEGFATAAKEFRALASLAPAISRSPSPSMDKI